jgi:hypothetical protein
MLPALELIAGEDSNLTFLWLSYHFLFVHICQEADSSEGVKRGEAFLSISI